MQFLDMMNAFLERNDIALIGPSAIEIQQTQDAGIPDSKPFFSLTCEIRYAITLNRRLQDYVWYTPLIETHVADQNANQVAFKGLQTWYLAPSTQLTRA